MFDMIRDHIFFKEIQQSESIIKIVVIVINEPRIS